MTDAVKTCRFSMRFLGLSGRVSVLTPGANTMMDNVHRGLASAIGVTL